ncbi:MAG: hypothetical protein ABIY62_08510, partial [Ginsengibacter sp.]
ETTTLMPEKNFLKLPEFTSLINKENFTIDKISETFSQKLTHQTITGRFIHITLKSPVASLNKYKAVSKKELALLPFPKFIASYLED